MTTPALLNRRQASSLLLGSLCLSSPLASPAATTPTITAIGAAKLFVFFVPKGHTAIPAIASGYIDIGFIDEFHGHSP
mgnify:CR=1 FL=1